jgi:hypothetical protein
MSTDCFQGNAALKVLLLPETTDHSGAIAEH